MVKIKDCPFCRNRAKLSENGKYSCLNKNCPLYWLEMTLEQWQYRPIEDIAYSKMNIAKSALENIIPDGDGPVYMENYNYDIAQEAKIEIEKIK